MYHTSREKRRSYFIYNRILLEKIKEKNMENIAKSNITRSPFLLAGVVGALLLLLPQPRQ